LRCAVFASGSGSNFQALLDRKAAGDLHVEFVLVLGNNSKAGAFEKAQKYNIPTVHLTSSQFADEQEYVDILVKHLNDCRAELIILAGYMKKLPSEVVRMYRNRIVNIHPGLLPAFGGKGMYGLRVHQAVLDYGARITGVTVHFVDEEYDHGPIIMQEIVKVENGDDAEKLAARVLKVEHATLWRAIEKIAKGLITLEGRRVMEHD
jgi:formyltetrahydrofolate-dependent phosphoribosylglycinamide formyltransferase